MAEAASITEDIKKILNSDNTTDSSKILKSKPKKRLKTPKLKAQQKGDDSGDTANPDSNSITGNSNNLSCANLSISVDQQGNRTLHQEKISNSPKDDQRKNPQRGKRGTPKNKQNGKDNIDKTNETKPNILVSSESMLKSSPKTSANTSNNQNKNSNAVVKHQSNKGKKTANIKETSPKPNGISDNDAETTFKKKLEKNWIFPLRKKSTKFPRANFFCRICSYHLDVAEDCNRHMGEKRHQRRKEVTESENILRFIPKPTEKQLESIHNLLECICNEQILSHADIELRISVMKIVEEHVKEMIPDVQMKMYGSSISGFGLKTSNINIYVHSPSSKCMPKVLVMIYEQLMKSGDKFRNVENDFYSKVPAVIYEDPATSIKCQLTINSCSAGDTSRLLSIYSSLDQRVLQLGIVFRTWAKICGLDRQKEGTLPAYSLCLMTIYYLQNTSPPVLPTFHKNFPKFGETEKIKEEWFSSVVEEAAKWKIENKESLSQLWLGLLRFYTLTFDTANDVVSIKLENLTRTEKKWNSKKLAIEDPFAPKLNVARTVSNAMIYEYLQDTLRKAYHYFGLPRNKEGQSWIPLTNLEKLAAAYALEDYKRNDKLATAAENCHETSPDSGGTREDNNGNKDSCIVDEDETTGVSDISFPAPSLESSNSNITILLTNCDKIGEHRNKTDHPLSLVDFARSFAEKVISHALEECKDGIKKSVNITSSDSTVSSEDKTTINPADYINLDSLQDKYCFYKFTEDVLSDGKGLPVICSFCEGEGHLKTSCPEDILPNLRPLPSMTVKHLQVLTKTLQNVIYDFAPSVQEKIDRKRILKDIEGFIQRYLYADACLQLFGSSCNGFGFSKSDLDICLTFKDKTSEGLDFVQVIKNLSAKLDKHDGLRSITPITTAKVPIVKFRHRQSGLEGDISLYNTLAQHNTKLLEAYSCIDERVSILGYAFKVFAKICDIGDASKGSLSSYAYVLMLIHYLQQCQPPVVPVLQELYTTENKPELMIEGWNVWFYEDLKLLPNVWPNFQKNTQDIGELWLGLFKYYSEFPIKDNVINIRQKHPLTRFEKLWNGECLAIEDPFDLNHNLGGGLSKKMNNYILHALINARELYGTPFETVPQLTEKYISPADYFFDPLLLTEGRPPNDRGCRECGKIGHIAKKCPQHLKNLQRKKEREIKYREQKQQQQQQNQLLPNHQQQHHPKVYPSSQHQVSQQYQGGVYNDRNATRNSSSRDQRRRNNSSSESVRDKAPLLPNPVMRMNSHSGSPMPLMAIHVDNNMTENHQPLPYNVQQQTPLSQVGPNGGQNCNNKNNILPFRHKTMYDAGSKGPQGRL